jgi:hypothetical protein
MAKRTNRRLYFPTREQAYGFKSPLGCILNDYNELRISHNPNENPHAPWVMDLANLSQSQITRIHAAQEGFRWGQELAKMTWDEKNQRMAYPD